MPGSIRIGEQTVAADGLHLAPERRRIGYVAQEGALFPHLSVSANVLFGLAVRGRRGQYQADEYLRMVGLSAAYANRWPHELSGGEQQRVALARALAPRPSLVLLDEPFSALDAALRLETRNAVAGAIAAAGATALLVTHDQSEAPVDGTPRRRAARRAADPVRRSADAVSPPRGRGAGRLRGRGGAAGRHRRCRRGDVRARAPGVGCADCRRGNRGGRGQGHDPARADPCVAGPRARRGGSSARRTPSRSSAPTRRCSSVCPTAPWSRPAWPAMRRRRREPRCSSRSKARSMAFPSGD